MILMKKFVSLTTVAMEKDKKVFQSSILHISVKTYEPFGIKRSMRPFWNKQKFLRN